MRKRIRDEFCMGLKKTRASGKKSLIGQVGAGLKRADCPQDQRWGG